MVTKRQWDRQLAFNRLFIKDELGKDISELTLKERVDWTEKYLLHLIKEQAEVLDEIPFKMHRVYGDINIIKSNILEELTDIQKFLLGIYQLWGFTYNDYINEFNRKTLVVEQRYRQEHELKLMDPKIITVGIDLDGVIFDYPKCFIDWVKDQIPELRDRITTLKELKSSLRIETYEALKDGYRQSGIKACLPLKDGAKDLINFLKRNNIQIIGLSSRPYDIYSRIYADTLESLKNNDISLDALFFSENKCLTIVKSFPHISFFIDDDYEQVKEISDRGYKVIWVVDSNEYDNSKLLNGNIFLANNLVEVIDVLYNILPLK